MPNISVIIPNYNHARFLKQRVNSVLQQTYQDFEVIIMDDNSSDHSKDIIEQYRNYPKISHIIYNETNSGSTFKQWKKGLELAKGEWIWIAESDDYADTDFLEQLLGFSTNDNNIQLIYCDSFSTNENSETQGIISWARDMDPNHWSSDFINDGKDEIKSYLFWRNTIPNASAVLVKKESLVRALSSLPPDFRYAGDWFIWVKCIEDGKIGFLKENLNFFRQHANSTRSAKSIIEEKKRFEEYFYVINYIENKYHIELDAKKHSWIIYEWLYKKFQKSKLINRLSPQIPLQYKFNYYKLLVIKNILTIFKSK